jgi:predicted Zn finger-like uncharacterized protein
MAVKVECESCKTPYTIDERRIPAAGLKVRCPKCTKTFVIRKPGASMAPPPPSTATPAPAQAAPAATATPARPQTVAHEPTPPIAPPGIDLPPTPPPAAAPKRPRAATIAFAGAPGALPLPVPFGAPIPAAEPKPAAPTAPAAPAAPIGPDFGDMKLPATAPQAVEPSAPPAARIPQPAAAKPAAPAAPPPAAPPPIEPPKIEPPGKYDDLPALAGLPPVPTASGDKPAPRNMARRTVVGLGGAMPSLAGAIPGLGALSKEPAKEPAKDAGADLPAVVSKGAAPTAPKPGGFGELDLPAVAAPKGAPAPKPTDFDLPAVAAPKGAHPAAPKPGGFGELDLPAVAAKGGAAGAPKPGADLPAVVGPKGASAPKPTDFDLPAVAAPKGAHPAAPKPGGFGELDLPAVAPKGHAPKPGADLPAVAARPVTRPAGEADLPAVAKPGARGADLPAAKGAVPKTTAMGAPPSPAGFGELDLPAVAPVGNLPAAKSATGVADLPAVGARGPAPTRGGFGELDLPAVAPAGRDLPAPKQGGFGELDLPAVAPMGNLPAAKQGGFGELDLPAVAPMGNLPVAKSPAGVADLPMVAPHGNLPSPKVGFGELDLDGGAHLPAIGQLPAAREPSIAQSMGAKHDPRELAVAQTMVGPGVTPSRGFDFDAVAPPADLFGGGGPPQTDLGLRAGTAQGFGELDFDAKPQQSPRAATGVGAQAVSTRGGGGFADFGELELPGPGAPGGPTIGMEDMSLGASPSAQTFGGDGDAPKAVRKAPSLMLDSNAPPAAFGAPDGFGETPSIPAPPPAPTEASIGTSPGAGGMSFGEVDLGGGGEEDMEFGAIPQEHAGEERGSFDRSAEALPYKPRDVEGEKLDEPEVAPKKKGKAGRVVLALVGLLVIGGATLEFTKYGAFARHVISDRLNADKHAATLRDATTRTQQAFGEDSLARSTDAVAAINRDVEAAPRYAPLVAYAAYANWAHQIRFGKDGGADAKAQALLGKAIENPGPNKQLAEAARDVLAGQLPAARATLNGLLKADAKNVDAAVTLGELELRAKQPKDAIAAFTRAKAAQDSPRTRAGLMRAYEAAGDLENAKKEAEAIVAKSQTHVPARLFLAHYAWEKSHDEKRTLALIDEIRKPALVAASSPAEQIDALSLKGFLLLDRGRITEAKGAFDQAMQTAKSAPAAMPQLGLGEVHMANGQYPLAIAAFKAAAEAQPDLTVAKIGIARAQLKLEKPADARATLTPLKDPKLASEIGYWLGQASEKLTPDKPQDAIKIYDAAIKAQPSEVKPYIALANLQAKAGQTDAATATLDAALKAVPPSEKLHIAVGELKFRQGRYVEALAEFDKALELQPENLEALFDRGRCQLRMEGPESLKAGKETLEKVEKKDPKYPGLALEMGYYYQQTHQLDEALKRYQSALEAAPNDIDVKLQVGRAMVESRDPNAEATLRDVLDKCRTNSSVPDTCELEAKHYLGRALLNRTSWADAIVFLKQAVDKVDANAAYNLYYGWALKEMDRLDEADRYIARALELDQSLGDAYWLRAEILVKQQKYKDAMELAEKALKLTPSRYEAHATIAMALKGLSAGNAAMEAQAIGEWEKALAGDPNNPKAPFWRYLIADLMYYRNEIGRAVPHLKECIKLLTEREQKPPYLPKAYFYLGMGLRFTDKEEAKKALKTYLDTSVGTTDPARAEARAAYTEAGGVYTGP